MFSRRTFLLSLLVAGALALPCDLAAQEGKSKASSGSTSTSASNRASDSGGAAASAKSSSSASFTPTDELEPLDPWYPIEPEEISSSSSAEESTPEVVPNPDTQELDSDIPPPPPEKPNVLLKLPKQQAERIKAIRQQIFRRALADRRRRAAIVKPDPRGAAELRVCSVDLANYGLTAEVSRLAGKSVAAAMPRKIASVIGAIVSLKCDMVAVQSVVARDFGSAKESIDRLAKRVSLRSGAAYDGYVSAGDEQLAYNGILVRHDAGKIQGVVSLASLPLPRFEFFDEKSFYRAPFQLLLDVAGKDGKPGRRIDLVVFDFGKGLRGDNPPESARMQMAAALHRFAIDNQHNFDPQKPHILIMTGERRAKRSHASAMVIEGRVKISEFRKGGKCTLINGEKTGCAPEAWLPADLVGVTTEGLL